MNLTLECEQEEGGRWLAEVPQIPGVIAYGATSGRALARTQALALRVLAERVEHGELSPLSINIQVHPVR